MLSPLSPKIKIHDNVNNEDNCMVVKVVPVVVPKKYTTTLTTGTTAWLYRLFPLSSKIKIHDNYNNENNCMVVKVVPVVVQNKIHDNYNNENNCMVV